MEPRRNLRAWIAGAAIGLLLALLIIPQTGGIVRSQIGTTLGRGNALMDGNETVIEDAARYPDDVQVQIRAAGSELHGPTNPPTEDEYLKPLSNLENKFPNDPSVYAYVLRTLCGNPPLQNRPEGYWISGQQPPPPERTTGTGTTYHAPPFPAGFFDRTAAAGERLDPDNAFFPFMRAAGLYQQGKDAEAMAEVHAAAQKPAWREYFTDEIYGGWKISRDLSGWDSALGRISISAAILFPHYATLRAVARIELYKAMVAEQSGNVQEGLSIREDIMRCGGLMRAEGDTYICSLVGIAIASIGTANPGGKVVTYTTGMSGAEKQKIRVADFNEYLSKISEGSLVGPVTQELSAGTTVRSIGFSFGVYDPRNIAPLIVCWVVDYYLLASILAFLVLGGVAYICVRSLHLDSPRSVPAGWKLPIALGVGFSIAIVVAQVTDSIDASTYDAIAFVVAVAGMLAPAIVKWKTTTAKSVWMDMVVFACSSVGVLLLLLAYLFEAQQSVGGLQTFMELFSTTDTDSQSGSPDLYGGVFLLVIPLLITFIVLVIVNRIRKVPVLNGSLISFSKGAVPIALGIAILYGGFVVETAIQDKRINYQIGQETAIGEGQYNAQQAGRQWPGVTDWGPGS